MDRIIVVVILLALITSCDINKNINQNNEPVTTFENNNENPTDNEQIEVENNIVDDKTETKINVVNETINNNTIVKSQTYEGVISDIKIQMQLDYYEDNTIQGTYFYEKFKENIELTGELNDENTIILKTVDNTETFLGKISGGNISGKWISNDKNLYFNIWCENGDEYATGSGTNYLLDTDDIVYDSDNIYYSLNNCLYKSSYDGTYRSFYYVGRRTKCV